MRTTKLVGRSPANDIYRSSSAPDLVFFWKTDRYSVNDIIFPEAILYKGLILNQMSLKWMRMLEAEGITGNHVFSSNPEFLARYGFTDLDSAGCVIAAKTCIPIPLECIVRGYYVPESKSWAPYKLNQNMYGNVLPAGLAESQQLATPIYTPSTRARPGKEDQYLTFEQSAKILYEFVRKVFDLKPGSDPKKVANSLAKELKEKSLSAYIFAHEFALKRGIILADAKLEFGICINSENNQFEIVLMNDVFTPDSSRFWDVRTYEVGKKQPSMDKQFLIQHVFNDLKWNGKDNPPEVSDIVRSQVSDIYCEIFQMLFDVEVTELSIRSIWDCKMAVEKLEKETQDAETQLEIENYFNSKGDSV